MDQPGPEGQARAQRRIVAPLVKFLFVLGRLRVTPEVYWRVATADPRALPRSVGLTRWSRPEWPLSRRRIASFYVFVAKNSWWGNNSGGRTVWYCGNASGRYGWWRDDDLPSIVWANGHRYWWRFDNYARDDDKPTAEQADGAKKWCIDQRTLHRGNDLPAIIKTNGYRGWYYMGDLHRDNDRPAIEHPNGAKAWYVARAP